MYELGSHQAKMNYNIVDPGKIYQYIFVVTFQLFIASHPEVSLVTGKVVGIRQWQYDSTVFRVKLGFSKFFASKPSNEI